MQSSAAQARMLGKFSGKSDGCQMSRGKCAAKYAACWPVPLPISSTKPERGKTSFSTARIGSLLRSHDGGGLFQGLFRDTSLKNIVRKQRYTHQMDKSALESPLPAQARRPRRTWKNTSFTRSSPGGYDDALTEVRDERHANGFGDFSGSRPAGGRFGWIQDAIRSGYPRGRWLTCSKHQRTTSGLHLKNIFADGELSEEATTEDSSVVRQEGKRQVTRKVSGHYNLDAIISVGYRVSSKRAVQFR